MSIKLTVYQNPLSLTETIYYVGLPHCSKSDGSIAELLDMTLEEYTILIQKYNATSHWTGYVFRNFDDAINFADYLNKEYLLILTLAGKIYGISN